MRAVQFKEYGTSDVLEVVQIEAPHAGPGEVRVAVRAAGVNAMDWKIRSGQLQEMMPVPLPSGSGFDACGVVDEVGEGVAGVSIGDVVFGTGSGTYAERAVLTDWAAKPDEVSFAEAAGYPIAVATAQRILDLVGVEAGTTVLISGAAGGVGSAAVQFARALNATVIGTASLANHEYLRSLGATPTTYGEGLVERVRALAPEGVDAALDIAGSGVIAELVEIVGDPSQVVSIADFTAGDHGAQVSGGGGDRRAALTEAARLVKAGQLSIPVAETVGLDDAAAAQDSSQAGHVQGRRVIVIE